MYFHIGNDYGYTEKYNTTYNCLKKRNLTKHIQGLYDENHKMLTDIKEDLSKWSLRSWTERFNTAKTSLLPPQSKSTPSEGMTVTVQVCVVLKEGHTHSQRTGVKNPDEPTETCLSGI